MTNTHRIKVRGPERRRRYTERSGKLVHICHDCNKHAYVDRDAAKSVAKNVHRREKMNTYRCPFGTGYHLGHLSPAIVAGRTTRVERYG